MAYKAKSKRGTGPRTYRGKPVKDTDKPFSFVVTDRDRKRGKTNDPEKCAGACAIKRSYPGEVVTVHVHRNVTMIELKDKVIRYRTGHSLRDQIVRFDAGRKFDAGKYVIHQPAPSQIAARGRAHSPPDRPHGVVNGPNARKKALSLHHIGRETFHFTTENSDYKKAARK